MINIDLTNFRFIINFDYVAMLVMTIMLIYMFVGRLISLRRSKIFTVVILLSMIATSFDIFRANIINKMIETSNYNSNMLIHANILQTLYYLFLLFATLGFFLYVIDISCGTGYLWKKKLFLILLIIPALTMLTITIMDFFGEMLLTFVYANGKLYLKVNFLFIGIVFGLAMVYLVLTIVFMVRFRSVFEKKQTIGMSLILPLVAVGLIAEMIVDKLLVLGFMISICIILVQTILEASEDLIDENTKLYNMSEFIKRVRKIYINKENKYLLLIKTTNYHELIKEFDSNDVYEFNMLVTKTLNDLRKMAKMKDELFSLNNGYYASFMSAEAIKHSNSDNFRDSIVARESKIDFIPVIERCLLELPNDFDSADEVVNFVNNYRQAISFNRTFTVYHDVKDDKNLIIANHLEQIIDTGLKENEFVVYYQPIYSTKTKKFKTAEALVRLNSKKYGFISPASFIPYAEKTGRINEIDSFVMEEVFKFVSSSIFQILELEYIEINLSMAECVDPNLVDRIKELMERYSIDPKNINLEITESFDASEMELINNNLNQLVELGFKFSLDDYGTGYSNINRFSKLPISIVKIDKSLVDESEDINIKKLLDYSFNIVKDLDKQTVVEGVETKEQLDRFIDYGATYIQGYYFSNPLNYDSYIDFVHERNK